MQVTIIPSPVKGHITAPTSKSVMQRICAAALLHAGDTLVHNFGVSEDDQAALRMIQQLGATVQYIDDRSLKITSSGKVSAEEGSTLDCGESGLSLRMFLPVAALSASALTFTGSGSLQQRPVAFLEEVLTLAGVAVALTNGSLPVMVRGPLQAVDIAMDGSVTSQLLSGLLMAYAATGAAATIDVVSLKSKPYIDLTLKVMEDFGMSLPVNNQYRSFRFSETPGRSKSSGTITCTVEGDWSNAAFLLVAGAVAGSVTVIGLDVFTTQADKKILEALQDCGCRLSIRTDAIEVNHQPLKAFHFDATDCPDLIPPLTALAACCEGTTVLEGASRLTHKESNRAETLKEEFAKLGITIEQQDDKLIVRGGDIRSAALQSHKDHRIAMACAVAALRAQDAVTISHADAVNKSYPRFWDDLARLSVVQQPLIS